MEISTPWAETRSTDGGYIIPPDLYELFASSFMQAIVEYEEKEFERLMEGEGTQEPIGFIEL